ncbi:Protein-arginine rhamnosyltransferase OS=Castellaniella defragrans OX=75697 GN=HNR28_001119 PE=3 SV=1 [Castellaniella defragrans]
MAPFAFDIFCRVVDNYGDAGVCWRLARQLAARGHPVRLWIDDDKALSKLVPALRPQEQAQRIEAVEVLSWDLSTHAVPPSSGVVIEAFACSLPPAYEAAMARQHCLWINLEYLSAEDWVEGCHGLPSPQSNGVPKYFYFPGFTPATGGLLREADLFERRAEARRLDRRVRLRALTGLDCGDLPGEARCVLLFSYPDAPFKGLQQAFARDTRPTWLLVPGEMPAGLHDEGALRVRRIPFVSQAHFDELLWCCDLNFVRGEDSLVRALWAGIPLVWHIYRQDDDAHLAKLDAWMARAHWPATVQALHRAWNGRDGDEMARALMAALHEDAWQAWQARTRAWSQALSAHPDLTSRLLDFCMRHRQKS